MAMPMQPMLMTSRARAKELEPPPEPPLPANVLDFFAPPRLPFAVPPIAVLLMAERQRERATAKAVARQH